MGDPLAGKVSNMESLGLKDKPRRNFILKMEKHI